MESVVCLTTLLEIATTMAPIALSHGDGAPGVGVEDCITRARRHWLAEFGRLPRRRPTRRRASRPA